MFARILYSMLKIFGIIGKNLHSINNSSYINNKEWGDLNYKISICGLDSFGKCIAEDNDYLIVFQGNLFNKYGLEKPARYILDLYNKKQNTDFLKDLNGSFNFVLINKKLKLVFVVTDKYGSRPLYIYQKDNLFFFGSEVKLLSSLLDKKPPINWKAWGEYLTFRFTLGEATFFTGIRLISNGTFFKINYKDKVEVTEKKYWDFSLIHVDTNSSYEQKVSEGVSIFKEVFQGLGDSIKGSKTIVALSGGYDSRSIVAGLKKFSESCEFDTITTLHPAGSERSIVQELSKALKLKNIYVNRPKSIYKHFFVQKAYLIDCLTQEHLWVMPMLNTIKRYDTYIDGIAGDIIMRSTRVRPIHINSGSNSLFLAKLFKKQFGFEYQWLKSYLDPKIWEDIKYTETWAIDELDKIPVTENRMAIFLMKNRVRNGISVVPNNIVGDCIKTVIQPFFNDKLVNFGLSIPHKYKFKFIYREIINKAFPEIREIVSTSDENLDKLEEYDERILQFDKNPRELISDYSEISKNDSKYLFDLLGKLDFPPFLEKERFVKDVRKDLKINRVNTILDIILWFDMFMKNMSPNEPFL